jgi:TonB family protein
MKLPQSMKRAVIVALCIASSIAVHANQIENEPGSAIDAHGVRHVASGFGPSALDLVFAPKPDYPYSERSHHNEGTAVVRMDIDLKTGNTTYVTLIRSSGFPKLDEAAVRALARWRFKPGKWKEAEVPVTFTMHGPPPTSLPGSTHSRGLVSPY